MIPTRLELHNFGAIDTADVDLSTVDLAAVVGPNGAGKSTTFTIAPLWALFGSSKNGCPIDSLVKLGTSDASVTLEFEHRGEMYRAHRTRSVNGRGKSSLELQKQENGAWASISGTTIRETEEKIRDLLGLDEETFTSSSMILQGRSNEFTAKAPGQRKQILSQILGLEIYETLQEGAKKHVQELDARLRSSQERLGTIGELLSGKPDLTALLKVTEADIQAASLDISKHEDSLQEAETRLIKAREAGARIKDLEVRISGLKARFEAATKKRDELAIERERLERVIAQEPEVIGKVEELAGAEEELRELEPLEARRGTLREEYASCDQELKANRKTVEEANVRLKVLRQDLSMGDRYREAAEQLPGLNAEILERHKLRHEIMAMEKEAEKVDDEICEKKHRLAQARLRLESEVRNCQAQADKLADAHCVDLEAARLNPCAFLKGAMEAAERLPALKTEIESLCDPEIARLQTEKDRRYAEIKEMEGPDPDALRTEALGRQIEALEPLAAKAASLESKQEMVTLLEVQQATADEKVTELAGRLSEIQREGEDLKSRLEELPMLKARIESLQPWKARKEQLPAAKERLSWVMEQIESLTTEVTRMDQERTDLLVQLGTIRSEADPLEIEREAAGIRNELKNLRTRLQELHSTFGAVKARLEELSQAESERKTLKAEREPLAVELTRYQALAKAFGRDGIPALIIENAVPELERISNEILGEMSHGRHSLRFETQRELKSRAGMAETLDIIVSDWQGERPYETFSGGEQLRIDYAIRFALAELLAHRAGSRIEWLVIDEGLGSQDREHRDLVLEAIRNVANRFRRVLVITHVEEAQGAFPQQIRFETEGDKVEVLVS